MSGTVRPDVRRALGTPDLRSRLGVLGFDDVDADAALDAAAAVLDRPRDLAVVAELAERLVARLGVLPFVPGGEVVAGLLEDGIDEEVPALLALLATAPAVAAFHASRGVPPDVSAATLADLGQQVRVHRLVTGGFGLGTYSWVAGPVWSGALYRLGRLQYDLELVSTVDGTGIEWVLSTHVPRDGRLAPEDVDASLAAAPAFFAAHFAEVAVRDVHCRSWLLDPRLPEVLPGSNLAAFSQRWRTYGQPVPGDEDAMFFGFARHGPVELDALPTGTALQRALLALWRSGESWHLVEGRLAR